VVGGAVPLRARLSSLLRGASEFAPPIWYASRRAAAGSPLFSSRQDTREHGYARRNLRAQDSTLDARRYQRRHQSHVIAAITAHWKSGTKTKHRTSTPPFTACFVHAIFEIASETRITASYQFCMLHLLKFITARPRQPGDGFNW
jgi:hypothetical protein